MKVEVFIEGDYVISPLGNGTAVNMEHIMQGRTGIRPIDDAELAGHRIHAARIDEDRIGNRSIPHAERYTRLERLLILTLQALMDDYGIALDNGTLVVLSSTKGNVALLHHPRSAFPEDRVHLHMLADVLTAYFRLPNPVITVSNACISGSLAIAVARQLLQNGAYERAIVVGGDELSKFIVSGFDAFQALADEPCRPFDLDRKGLNLGEAIAAVYLTKTPSDNAVRILGVGSYNDANHISGPSRTGEGLYRSIRQAMQEAGEPTLDFISAHGTATPYNDEMEAIALHRCGLQDVPLHSLKGYYGHTLGASGLVETIIGIRSLRSNQLVPSFGFHHQGTSKPLHVITQTSTLPLHHFLKTASGFGGCNIATVFQRV